MMTQDSYELPNFFSKRGEVVPPYDSLHVRNHFGGFRFVSFLFRAFKNQGHFLVHGHDFICVRPRIFLLRGQYCIL